MTGSNPAKEQSASPKGAGVATSPKSTGGSPRSKSGSPKTPAAGSSPKSAGSPRNLDPIVDPGVEQAVEADDVENPEDDNDTDSALGEPATSTASIASSILRYRTIHGRRFHSDTGNALYWGSNDEVQSESMDIIHHMWTIAQDGKLYLAPLSPDIKKAVDIGCGTGMWAIDFADEFPSCEVIGTDISPIQPSWVPPNLKFEVDDCTQEWTWEPESIDYVHIRYLVGTIGDWTDLFQQAFRTLKPGGYLESFEASPYIESDDGSITPKMAMGQWGDIFVEGSKKTGRSFTVLSDGTQRKAMEEAGFVDLQEWNYKCPLSPWAKDPKLKEMGLFGEAFATRDPEGFLTFVSSILGWSRDQFMVFNAMFRKEVHDYRNHGYFRIKVVWGRKP